MPRVKPGDVVVLNDYGIKQLRTFPHMKTLRSIVRSVERVPGLQIYDVELVGFDGKPNELSPFMLIDTYFDKVA